MNEATSVDIRGSCHCGNLTFALAWPAASAQIPARACGCTFCIKHGGVWSSDPAAELDVVIHAPSFVSRYAFGTKTAEFHVCARCGVVPVVTSEIAGHLYAVVSVNAFEGVDSSRLVRSPANFDGEGVGDRLARRTRNWISQVRLHTAASGRGR